MTATGGKTRLLPSALRPLADRPAAVAVTAAVAVLGGVLTFGPQAGLHGPDLALFAAQPLKVQMHVLAALGAFGLGLTLFVARKGDLPHRTLGYIWVALMATVALSSLFITAIKPGSYSLIHLLSGWTLLVMPIGVIAARRHDVVRHRRTMTGLFLGGMVLAGAFTFLPGRLMWRLFMG